MNRNKISCIAKDMVLHILFCALTLIFFTNVLSINFVPSESMEPTIQRNRFIVNLRLRCLIGNPIPKYGEVIVFRENADSNRLLVKRVIGLPGDEITFSGGVVYRNGEEIREPYLLEQQTSYSVIPFFTVPDGALFVMGDNRENSKDSRFMKGTYVPVENVYAEELFQVSFF